ncbi:Uncharacterized protein HZ326_18908 [Fusarium oxysporum f. sp. albedinis]|nr:hypothetical protein HZ326_26117 [Fusarium oxysporum f. sp. albedinis]KAJ0138160.1 Uncharacterized protein HZ326_18908 [Fusarium oxysporum f. sp. albedinis]
MGKCLDIPNMAIEVLVSSSRSKRLRASMLGISSIIAGAICSSTYPCLVDPRWAISAAGRGMYYPSCLCINAQYL